MVRLAKLLPTALSFIDVTLSLNPDRHFVLFAAKVHWTICFLAHDLGKGTYYRPKGLKYKVFANAKVKFIYSTSVISSRRWSASATLSMTKRR